MVEIWLADGELDRGKLIKTTANFHVLTYVGVGSCSYLARLLLASYIPMHVDSLAAAGCSLLES